MKKKRLSLRPIRWVKKVLRGFFPMLAMGGMTAEERREFHRFFADLTDEEMQAQEGKLDWEALEKRLDELDNKK